MPSVAIATVPTVIGPTPPKPAATRDRRNKAGHESRYYSASRAPPQVLVDTHHDHHRRGTKSVGRRNVTPVVDYGYPTKHRQHSSTAHNAKHLHRSNHHFQLGGNHAQNSDRRRHSSSSTIASRQKLYPSLSVLKRVDEYIRAGREDDNRRTPSKQPRPRTPVNISDDAVYSTDHYANTTFAAHKQLPAANGTNLIRKPAAISQSERKTSNSVTVGSNTGYVARDKHPLPRNSEKLPDPAGFRPQVSSLHATSFTTGTAGVSPRKETSPLHAVRRDDKKRQASFSEELDEDHIRQLIRLVHRYKRAFYSIKRDEDSFRDQLNHLLNDNRALRRYYMALKSEIRDNRDRQDDMTYRIDTVRGLLDEYCLPLLDTVHKMSREDKQQRIRKAFETCERRARSQSRPTHSGDEKIFASDDFMVSTHSDDVGHGGKSRAISREIFERRTSEVCDLVTQRHAPEPLGWKRYVLEQQDDEYSAARARHTQRTASSGEAAAAAGDKAAADSNYYARKNERGDWVENNEGCNVQKNAEMGNNTVKYIGSSDPAASGASSPVYINMELLQRDVVEQQSNDAAARVRRRAERIRALLLSDLQRSSDSDHYFVKPIATARENDGQRCSGLVSERLKKRFNERFSSGEAAVLHNSGDVVNTNTTEKRNESDVVAAEVSNDPAYQSHSDRANGKADSRLADKRLLRNKYRELAHRILRGASSLDDLSTIATESEKDNYYATGLPMSHSDQQVGGSTAIKPLHKSYDARQEKYAEHYDGGGAGGDASAQYNDETDRVRVDATSGSGDHNTYYAVENICRSDEAVDAGRNAPEKRSVSRSINNKLSRNLHVLAYREEQIERIRQICDENVDQLREPSSLNTTALPPPVPPRRNNKPSKILSTTVLETQRPREQQHYMTTPQNTPPTSSIGFKEGVLTGQNSKAARKMQHASVLMTPKHNSDHTTIDGQHHAHRRRHRRSNSPFDLAPVPPPRTQRAHDMLFKRHHPGITTADGRLVYNVGIQTEPLTGKDTVGGGGLDDVDFQRQRQSETIVIATTKQTNATANGTDSSNNAVASNNSPAKVSNTISTGSETQNQSTQTDSSLMTPSPPSKQTTVSSSQEEQHNNNVRFNEDRNNNYLYYNDGGDHERHHRHHTHMPAPPTAPAASSGSSATPTTPHNHGNGFPPTSPQNGDHQTIYCLHDEITPQSAAYNLLTRSQQLKTRNVLHYPLAGQVPIFPAPVDNGNVVVVKRALKMKHFKHANKYILRCPDELQIVQNNEAGAAVPPPPTQTPQPSTSLTTAAGGQSPKTNENAAATFEAVDSVLNDNRIQRMGGVLALPAGVGSAAAALAGSRTANGGVMQSNIKSAIIQSGSTVVETLPKSAMASALAGAAAAATSDRDQQPSSTTRSTTSVKVLQERRSLEADNGANVGTNTMRSSLSSSNRQAGRASATPDSVIATTGGSRSLSAAPPNAAAALAKVSTRNSKTTNLQDVSLSTVQFIGDVCPTKAGGYSIMFRSRTDNQVRLV